MSPEVLIYLQQVKNYFETSNDAKEYFIGDADEELISYFMRSLKN